MSEEIVKQEENNDKKAKSEFKMYQNQSIVFRHKIDPVTGEVIKE
jgi:hypothetical protein